MNADMDPEFDCAMESRHPIGAHRPLISQVENDNGVPRTLKCPVCGHKELETDYALRLTMKRAGLGGGSWLARQDERP